MVRSLPTGAGGYAHAVLNEKWEDLLKERFRTLALGKPYAGHVLGLTPEQLAGKRRLEQQEVHEAVCVFLACLATGQRRHASSAFFELLDEVGDARLMVRLEARSLFEHGHSQADKPEASLSLEPHLLVAVLGTARAQTRARGRRCGPQPRRSAMPRA